MPKRLVVLGDGVCCGAGAPPGMGCMDIIGPELQKRDVEVENWSHPGATAVGCHRQISMIRRKLEAAHQNSEYLWVMISLGRNDRMLGVKHDDIQEALNEILAMIIRYMFAHAIIMELVPDGIEHRLHRHWNFEKRRYCDIIKTPDPFRITMLKPHTGSMPTMVNYNFMCNNMVEYNQEGHKIIAQHTLKHLCAIMGLPRSLGNVREDYYSWQQPEEDTLDDEDGGEVCSIM